MNTSNSRETFRALIGKVVAAIADKPLDAALQQQLNSQFPANGEVFAGIFNASQAGVAEGWLCDREGGGIRYGRVYKPSPELGGFSIDVVDMNDIKGPHHRHPNGEIDLIMPLTPNAKFDSHGAGWLVYPAGSAHFPTVSEGRALVLYLLPQGAIEFTR